MQDEGDLEQLPIIHCLDHGFYAQAMKELAATVAPTCVRAWEKGREEPSCVE